MYDSYLLFILTYNVSIQSTKIINNIISIYIMSKFYVCI